MTLREAAEAVAGYLPHEITEEDLLVIRAALRAAKEEEKKIEIVPADRPGVSVTRDFFEAAQRLATLAKRTGAPPVADCLRDIEKELRERREADNARGTPEPPATVNESITRWREKMAPIVVAYLEKLYSEAKKAGDYNAKDIIHELKCYVTGGLPEPAADGDFDVKKAFSEWWFRTHEFYVETFDQELRRIADESAFVAGVEAAHRAPPAADGERPRKTRHDGDCDIYAAEVQICTCGYNHERIAVDLEDTAAVKEMDTEVGKELESRRVLSMHYHPEAYGPQPAADGEEVRTLKAKLAILKLITKEPGLDDVQIAERLGVPVIVVSLLMAGLYEDGLVEEHRAGKAKGEG